jgi:electron transfer flavoprotein alpha subunit
MEDDPLAFMRGEVVPENTARNETGPATGIVITLETDEHGKPTKASEELIGKALELNGELGSRVSGWLFGAKAPDYAKSFVHYGLDKILVMKEPGGNSKSIAQKFAKWAEENRPELWIFPESALGRRTAAWMAARLETGFVNSVQAINIDLNSRSMEMTHVELQGKLGRTIVIREARPQIMTLARGAGSPARLSETERSPIEILEL